MITRSFQVCHQQSYLSVDPATVSYARSNQWSARSLCMTSLHWSRHSSHATWIIGTNCCMASMTAYYAMWSGQNAAARLVTGARQCDYVTPFGSCNGRRCGIESPSRLRDWFTNH